MASRCKVYTPPEIVRKTLDVLGYKQNLMGKKFLENSCGNGNFLIEVVTRYIQDCRKQNIQENSIISGLEKDIVAFDIDPVAIAECIKRLDELLLVEKIPSVKWSIYNSDSLFYSKGLFDYIAGNPPYISYKDIETSEREKTRKKFVCCKEGKFDYYYAFVEDTITSLAPDGQCALVLPSSLYKNNSAGELRKMLLEHHVEIYDYGTKKTFKDIKTSTTILYCHKGKSNKGILYHDIGNKKAFYIREPKEKDKWYFEEEKEEKHHHVFGDFFEAANSVATLCNEAFLVNDATVCASDRIKVKGNYIEAKLIKPAYSVRSIQKKEIKHIIFPYHIEANGDIIPINEEEFIKHYPYTYHYLEKFRTKLDSRKSEKGAKWYEYGRSQGLKHMGGEKIVISSVITGKVKAYYLKPWEIPFAGIYIRQKAQYDLKVAKAILESDTFLRYMEIHSINSFSKSKRISVREIMNYPIDEERLKNAISMAEKI